MLSHFRIGTRLYLLVALFSLLLVFVGVVGLTSARKIDQSLETVYYDRVVPLKDLKVIADMYAVNIVDTSHKVRNGNMKWDEGRKNVAEAVKTISEKWKGYLATRLVPEEERLVKETAPLMQSADAAILRMTEILNKEDAEALTNFTVAELYSVIDPVSGKFSELVDVQLKVAKEEFDRSEATYATSKTISIASILLGILLGSGFGFALIRSITGPLAAGVKAAESLAEGDLTVNLEVAGRDEMSQLLSAMRTMADSLRNTIAEVARSSSEVASAANQLHSTAEQIATGAEEVAGQAGTVATAGEEMSATSGNIAQSCQRAAESAQVASQSASNGAGVVENTVLVMGQIRERVQETAQTVASLGARGEQIGAIIGTIEDIADQTNLLALNAAIEAARAGEQGRGFAVVADEVRALAERTTRATKEIGNMISAIQKETAGAVAAMEQGVQQVASGSEEAARSGEALQEILQQIGDVVMQVNQIATAAEEQTATTSEISGNILQITEVVQQTSRGAHESAAAAAQLSGNAVHLQRLVQQFRL